jgi:hypothetical protein
MEGDIRVEYEDEALHGRLVAAGAVEQAERYAGRVRGIASSLGGIVARGLEPLARDRELLRGYVAELEAGDQDDETEVPE